MPFIKFCRTKVVDNLVKTAAWVAQKAMSYFLRDRLDEYS